MRNNRFRKFNAGLTLIECALAVLIAGTTVISVLEISANTVNTATTSVDNRLGSLLASEIIAKETFGQFPENTESDANNGVPIGEQEYYSEGQDVDTEEFGVQYKGFSYEITKYYEDVDIFSQLSDDKEEEIEDNEEENADNPVVRIIRIKVVVSYPKQVGQDEPKTLTVETYIRPPVFASDGEEGEGAN